MRLLSRTIFRENFKSASLGVVLFTSVLFLRLSKNLFEYLVRSSSSPREVLYLFALVLPDALPFAIPLGVLTGTLLTLSRMSADGEITAMRAAGVPGRRVAPPILTVGFLAMLLTSAASLWLTPWAIGERYRVAAHLTANQLTADVQPRMFAEQFPNQILYASDVANPGAGPVSQWKRVFMADVTPPDKRLPGQADRGDTPLVTLAPEARAVAEVADNRVLLELKNVTHYQLGKDDKYDVDTQAGQRMTLEAQRAEEKSNSRPVTEMPTVPLYRIAYKKQGLSPDDLRDARVELNQRLALPMACLFLTLVGIPLGITSRRGGKSSAVILTMAIAFVYYIGMLGLDKMARQGSMKPEVAVWLPDLAFLAFGMLQLLRLEFPGERDYLARIAGWLLPAGRAAQQQARRAVEKTQSRSWSIGLPVLTQVIDLYILSGFVFYCVLGLLSFVLMYHVFEFFTLISDMIKNHIPWSHMLSYFLFLTPRLVYSLTGVAVLVAVLVVFGVMSKNNEVTAFKACGVSSYRLAAPVLLGGLLLSGSLFAFDHYVLPTADRKQDQLYNEIKNKAPQTYLRPYDKWVYGLHDRVFYYKYFVQADQAMLGVSVYEIDPVHFRLTRLITAERAKWEPSLGKWVFQNGWSRDFKGDKVAAYDAFPGATRTFAELEEKPDYFTKEKTQPLQMNFYELRTEIASLKQSGFVDTAALEVQLQRKFAEPLAALILALVSVPFAFSSNNRGGMAGVGISVVIFMAYFCLDYLFEQVGISKQLSPQMAAWSPDAIFSLVGLYFVARMRT